MHSHQHIILHLPANIV